MGIMINYRFTVPVILRTLERTEIASTFKVLERGFVESFIIQRSQSDNSAYVLDQMITVET